MNGRAVCARIAASVSAAGMILMPIAAIAEPATLAAALSSADAKLSGGFKVTLDPETSDFCYSLWAPKGFKATGAFVRSGAAGVDGPSVITLSLTGKDSDECLALEKDKLQPLIDKPGEFYVSIQGADATAPAMRGQLAKP